VGYLGGKVVSFSARKQWMNVNYQRLSLLALAVLAYVLAEAVEGNGFIAAFAAGLTLGNSARDLCPRLFEFGETEGQLLVLLTFIIFGGIMVLPNLSQIDAPVILYAVLSLTVARLGGVVLGLAGMHLRRETLLYLGWFGPRGIASVLYVLLVLDGEMAENRQEIFVIVTVTVLISVFAHGLTAYPGSRWYAARMEGTVAVPGAAEHEEVEPMPVRLPFRIGG
jgi:NhaP-type Na+/H+ or K+/H+ antiporter